MRRKRALTLKRLAEEQITSRPTRKDQGTEGREVNASRRVECLLRVVSGELTGQAG